MTSRFFCATAARRRSDPLIGTAAPARRWLLVEYAGAWAPRALESRGLAGKVALTLHRAAMDTGGRVLLVRRPGRRHVPPEQGWAVVDHDGRRQWGRWSHPEDLFEAERVFRAGPDPAATGAAAGAPGHRAAQGAAPLEDPLLLVCTHGLHDVCCAVRGRPVAAALATRWPEQTWECSHIGGDRFAASVLVVPDGTCYGRLDAASALTVVQGHLEGTIDLDHLRGFTTEPPVVQAALAGVLRELGPIPIAELRALSVTPAAEHSWRVSVRVDGPFQREVEARVTRTTRPPARLTCAAQADSTAYAYVVDAVHDAA